ncbi:uncharacterized protein LOC128551298 [Mercenaria mercenaria]|uniref:uncharacterized protein LOC128551298 n=1 Tax=Mercenaria mercenaria TaxID=6596 RepID=UPI00234F2AA0|nr:uncharacterized protein LOC128551298 [Mercenaria mercenaria]
MSIKTEASNYKPPDPSFPGSITLTFAQKIKGTNETINTAENRKSFRKKLEEAFKGSNGVKGIPGFKSVEVIRIILVLGGNRRKREASKSNKVQAEYIVHIRKNEKETTDAEKLTTALQTTFSLYMKSNKSLTIEIGNEKVQVSGADLQVYDVEENGLCMIPNRTDCDTKSTFCNNTFGGFECVCKPGYKPFLRFKKSCEGIE